MNNSKPDGEKYRADHHGNRRLLTSGRTCCQNNSFCAFSTAGRQWWCRLWLHFHAFSPPRHRADNDFRDISDGASGRRWLGLGFHRTSLMPFSTAFDHRHDGFLRSFTRRRLTSLLFPQLVTCRQAPFFPGRSSIANPRARTKLTVRPRAQNWTPPRSW